MSFSQENGYVPVTFEVFMDSIRQGINEQFQTTYTPETFLGTNWYKYLYVLVQDILKNETKTAEIFLKLQEYISSTNERIQRPSVSFPGLIDSFQSRGYIASVKKTEVGDAGLIFICVDVDDQAETYPETRLEICTLIKDFVAAGLISQGSEVESLTLLNGQSFDFRFSLPDRTPIILSLTLVKSENQIITLPSDEEIRQIVFENINARYRLGWDFEPQRYFTQADAPWAASILLEWSDDEGSTWEDGVFSAEFDDLFTFDLEDITVVMT